MTRIQRPMSTGTRRNTIGIMATGLRGSFTAIQKTVKSKLKTWKLTRRVPEESD